MISRKLITLLIAVSTLVQIGIGQNLDYLPVVDASDNSGFRRNEGQWDDSVIYVANKGANSVLFYSDYVSFINCGNSQSISPESRCSQWAITPIKSDGYFISGVDQIQTPIYYFTRRNSQGILTFDSKVLLMENVFPSIDCEYYFNSEQQLKYDVVVRPGGKPQDISFRYSGVDSLVVDETGVLNLYIGEKVLQEGAPVAYQYGSNGERLDVSVVYSVSNDTLSFKVLDEYDATLKLIIDPLFLSWSTYFYFDQLAVNSNTQFKRTLITDIAYDSSGNCIVVGETTELFTHLSQSYDTSFNGATDAFICKLTPNLDSILFVSYFGGTSEETRSLICVLDSGSGFVLAGRTSSNDLPLSPGAWDSSAPPSSTGQKSYVAYFSIDGTQVKYSTYIGGDTGSTSANYPNTVITSIGQIQNRFFISGYTNSRDYYTTSGSFQSKLNGFIDGFVSVFRVDTKDLLFSTYLGGGGVDVITDMTILDAGRVVVCGETQSSDFPTSLGYNRYFNRSLNGKVDGFIAILDTALTKIVRSRMIGGSGAESAPQVSKGASGEVFLSGTTNSNDFPTNSNAFMRSAAGSYDLFVMKMDEDLSSIQYSTYIGGYGHDFLSYVSGGDDVHCNRRGELYVAGYTESKDFPITRDATQKENYSATRSVNSSFDFLHQTGFIIKLSRDGDSLLYSTYWGGGFQDAILTLSVDQRKCQSKISVAGLSSSVDFPVTTGVLRDTIYNSSKRDTIYKLPCYNCRSSFISIFIDSIVLDPIDLGDTLYLCDRVSKRIDIGNYGADIRWTRGLEGSEVILRDTGWFHVWATYGCDTVGDSVYVALRHTPKVDLGKDSIFCDKFPSLSLDADNQNIYASYLWGDGSTSRSLLLDKPGKYWVRVSTEHCGSVSDTISLGLEQTPLISDFDTAICDGVPILLDAGYNSTSMNFHWSTGESTRSLYVADSTVIHLKLWNSCGSDSARITVQSWITPEALLPVDTLFCDSVDLKLVAGKPNNGEDYLWLDPKAGISLGTQNILFLAMPANVVLQISNSCGSDQDSMIIGLVSSTLHGRQDTLIECEAVSEILRTNGSPYDRYLWSGGSSADSLEIDLPGRYSVLVENACGLDSNIWWVVLKKEPRPLLIEDTTFCDRIDFLLVATVDDIDAVYSWQDGSAESTLRVTKAGSYSVTVSNACGKRSDQVNIDLLRTPVADLGADTAFCGRVPTLVLVAGNANNHENYLWQDGSRSASKSISAQGTYWLEISNRCGTDRDSIRISVYPVPALDLGIDTTRCGGFPIVLDAGNPGSSYLWQPGGETTQILQVSDYGNYGVTVTNQQGCVSYDEILITKECHSYYFIPTAFSPNGDGVNDAFRPVVNDVENYSLIIYNRWGEFVFETTDPKAGWNGKYKGEYVQNDIYYFQIKFRLMQSGEALEKSGRVHLLR